MAKEWTAGEVLKLAGGFKHACVLSAAVDLNVFGALAAGPMGAKELAAKLNTDPRATTVLLDALVAMELLTKAGTQYSVPPSVADVLTEAGPHSVVPMARHQGNCLRRWVGLASVVRSGGPAQVEPGILGDAKARAAFIGAMHNVSAPIAAKLIDALGPLGFRHLLDVGGASGTWTMALLRAAPDATATLFDLPEVISLAQRRIAQAGLADRVTFVGGDFMQDDLPAGADLAWVSAIVHQNSPDENRALFEKVHAALIDGGRILIRDIVMDESRTRPADGALFAINMLVATPGGGTYTFDELRDGLLGAGFARPTLLREGEWMDSVVGARKK